MDKKDINSADNHESKSVSFNDSVSDAEIGIFYNNPDLLFIFKKTQKISYALFIISDLFDSSEPLRVSLREIAALLIKNSLSLTKRTVPDTSAAFDNIVASFLEASSLCEAAYFSHLISEMNYLILKKEIRLLAESVDLKRGKRAVLAEDFFDAGKAADYKGHVDLYKGRSEVSYKGHAPEAPVSYVSAVPKINVSKNVLYPKKEVDLKERKSNRSEIILSLLKGGKELTIKDFLSHITDCSEKTIQRDLLAMVASNVLKKKGERRWSRYSL